MAWRPVVGAWLAAEASQWRRIGSVETRDVLETGGAESRRGCGTGGARD
jgi:hypothetical protein